MASREIDLIHDKATGRLRSWFDDPSSTTLAGILGGGPVKHETLTVNFFSGKDEAGSFTTQDNSGDTWNFIVRRPGKGAQGGTCSVVCGATTTTGVELPFTAESLQQVLNGNATIQSEVGSVEVFQSGNTYSIHGVSKADMTALTVTPINARPICQATISTAVAGTASKRELQTISILESPMVSVTSVADITTPAATATETITGSASAHEVQTITVSGYPKDGEVIATGPVTAAVSWDVNANAATVKSAINTDTASLVSDVKKVGRHSWQITFTALSTQTDFSPTYNGTEHHGVKVALPFSTVTSESIFAAEEDQVLDAQFEIVLTDTAPQSLYREMIQVDRASVDPSSLSAIDAAATFTWLGLTDTPSAYTGKAGLGIQVNDAETALEFSTTADGDVVGPASSLQGHIPMFSGTTGKIIQTSGVFINGSGAFASDGASGNVYWTPSEGTFHSANDGQVMLTFDYSEITVAAGMDLNASGGTIQLPAAAVDAITEIASGLKSGLDATLITGTKGTADYALMWNADGDAVVSGLWIRALGETYSDIVASSAVFQRSDSDALRLRRETGHGVASTVTAIKLQGYNDNGTPELIDYGTITLDVDAVTDGAEDGTINVGVMNAGAAKTIAEFSGTDVKVNGPVNAYVDTEVSAGDPAPAALECFGKVFYISSAATVTLPAVTEGMHLTIITIGAIAVSVDPNINDKIWLDGVPLDDGDKITNASTAGDIAVFTYYSADGWHASTNGWSDGGA